MPIDGRTVPNDTSIECDLCIVGAGAAGISMAREFAAGSHRVILLESGGLVPSAAAAARVSQSRGPTPVMLVHVRKGDQDLRLFTTITTLGTPIDVTAQELRIESYFPADEATDRLIRSWVAG